MANCKRSPSGDHETGMIQHRCFGPDQGKTIWCKHCHKKMPEDWIDPKRLQMIYDHLKGDKDVK